MPSTSLGSSSSTPDYGGHLYAALADLGDLIASMPRPQTLYTGVVQILERHVGAVLVLIGEIDYGIGMMQRRAPDFPLVGLEDIYPESVSIELAGPEFWEGKIEVSSNIAAAPGREGMQDAYARHGIRAAASVPVRCFGKVHVALVLRSRDPEFFSPELLQLLERIGLSMGCALEGDAQRRRLDQSLLLAERSQHALRLLSEALKAATHADTMGELFSEACRLVVAVGGYPACWLGLLVDAPAPALELRGHAGRIAECLDVFTSHLANQDFSLSLAAAVLQSGKAVVRRSREGGDAGWALTSRELELDAVLALPLCIAGQIIGVIVVGAESQDAFSSTEILIFEEMAQELSLGLARLRAHQQQEQAEQELNLNWRRLQCNIHDISERDAAEAKVQRDVLLCATLSQTRKAIMHCTSEDELFQQVCRIAVQSGGMKIAWIGLIDPDTLSVQPIASFGDDTGYLKVISISADAAKLSGRDPMSTAIRENRMYWCQDFQANPTSDPWREHAARTGLAASASLPLHRHGIVVGAFTLYSGEVNAFDEAASSLLREMASDISFALDKFARDSQRQWAEEHIVFKNAILKTQQETSLDAILVVDENGRIISYNQKFIALWRLPPHLVTDSVNSPVLQFVTSQVENTEVFAARVQYLNEHRDETSREEISLKDGRIVDRYSAPCNGADGRHYGRVWYFRDITERKQSDRRVTYLNRVHTVLSGINTLIVRVSDRDELFRESCRIAVEVAGFRMAMLAMIDGETGKAAPVASAGKSQDLMVDIRKTLASDQLASTTMVSRAIREKRAIVSNNAINDPQLSLGNKYISAGIRSLVVLPLLIAGHVHGALALYASESNFFHDDELNLLQQLASDIAFAIDHIGKQEQLNYLAFYDVLTGLANRKLFLERLAQYMRSTVPGKHKLAICLIDLERFKNINDSLGRPAGDALLKQVADWLTRSTGEASLLARIEADHFAVVLPRVGQEELARIVERTIEAFVGNPFRIDDAVFRITPKVGVAVFPEDGVNANTLFRHAETALKQAKASGDRYLFYTRDMTATVARNLSLENQLRRALDTEQFVLHYQPKANIVSGKITSVEALIRWNEPSNGLVPPDQFIPILEATGLIYDVGRWAVRKATADYLRWLDSGLAAVRIAVNVSPLQLRDRGFIDDIRQIIDSDARLVDALELEITESLIMADVKHSIASLQAIRAMGVRIAIDDFGTGFSSLSYLAKFPVDSLKIDRFFIEDMTVRPEGLALVSTIINLAHSLKLKVVAEGVETEEQLRLLRLLDCNEMQGFLISKPVPGEIFETQFLFPCT